MINNNSNKLNYLNLFDKKDYNKENNKYIKNFIKQISIIFIILWIVSGILGFLMSLICLIYNGNKLEKIIGLLISSMFFGPLYWLYYLYMDNYCSKKPIYILNKFK